MRPCHLREIDGVSILAECSRLTAALVISEAVLDAHDDPANSVSEALWHCVAQGSYHKLVNTTPNPRATKNSNGELVGPPPCCWLLCGGPEGVADGDAVALDDMFARWVVMQ